jgi:hypothetical protein
MMPLLIAAFDIATFNGCADGRAGGRPRSWSWDLAKAGKERPGRLAMLRDYADRYFAEARPDAVFYEKPLPIAALFAQVQKMGFQASFRMGATDETIGMLRGAIGVIEASAAKAKVPYIDGLDVQAARRSLTGLGKFPKGEGKDIVFDWCRRLGWNPANTDESDAMAIWSLGCGKMSPLSAHATTPLFAKR